MGPLRAQLTLALVAGCLAAGCRGRPESTIVEGVVQGAGFSDPHAIFSSQAQLLGVNDVSVLISDREDACDHLSGGTPSQVLADDGTTTLPSLVLNIDGQSHLTPDVRTLDGGGFTGSYDPGTLGGCGALDGGTERSCSRVAIVGGEVIIQESDHTGVDNDPQAVGSFDVVVGSGDRLKGTFVAEPCARVEGGCSAVPLGPLALLGLWVAASRLRGRSRRTTRPPGAR